MSERIQQSLLCFMTPNALTSGVLLDLVRLSLVATTAPLICNVADHTRITVIIAPPTLHAHVLAEV